MKLLGSAPIFVVSDISTTMEWYESKLGFHSYPFPKSPPHVFCILVKDRVEIMLQRLEGYVKPDLYARRPGGVWDVYLRMDGVRELYDEVVKRGDIEIVEPLCKQPYGDTEFVVRDLNGYVLVFSEGPQE